MARGIHVIKNRRAVDVLQQIDARQWGNGLRARDLRMWFTCGYGITGTYRDRRGKLIAVAERRAGWDGNQPVYHTELYRAADTPRS